MPRKKQEKQENGCAEDLGFEAVRWQFGVPFGLNSYN